MKKALFAMLTLALMGGQVFALTEYKTSEYVNRMFGKITVDPYGTQYNVTDDACIIVDSSSATGKPKTTVAYRQCFDKPITIVFDGDNVWNTNCQVSLAPSVNITSTVTTAQRWIDLLSDNEQVTLFRCNANSGFNFPIITNLEGVTQNSVVTLNGTTDTLTAKYIGEYIEGMLYTPTLNDGEIALIGALKGSVYEYSLVGKGLTKSPLAPEPATATLSLLALAGLASRRRRK